MIDLCHSQHHEAAEQHLQTEAGEGEHSVQLPDYLLPFGWHAPAMHQTKENTHKVHQSALQINCNQIS